MPVLIRPANNFLGQVKGSASEGKYNTVNNSTSREVIFQKCLNSEITLFHLNIATSHKHSPLGPTIVRQQNAQYWPDPKFSDIFFFSADYLSLGST